MQAVSNLYFPPQGWQGPERSDFGLRAPAGLIEWYVSVSDCFQSLFFVSFWPCVLPSYLSPLPQSSFLLPFSHFHYSLSASFLISPLPSHLLIAHRRSPLLFDLNNYRASAGNGLSFYFYPGVAGELNEVWVLFSSQYNREVGEKFISEASKRMLQYASASLRRRPTQHCNSWWLKLFFHSPHQSKVS